MYAEASPHIDYSLMINKHATSNFFSRIMVVSQIKYESILVSDPLLQCIWLNYIVCCEVAMKTDFLDIESKYV